MFDLRHKIRKAAGRPSFDERRNQPRKTVLKRLEILESAPLFKDKVDEIRDLRQRMLAIKPQRSTAREPPVRRVAAYATVRRDPKYQSLIMEMQPRLLETMIARHPGWQTTESYIDIEGSIDHAATSHAFERMMQDAQDGKFDLVFTRSLENLAPDFPSCMKTIDQFRKLGIPVYIADEQINSMEPDGEVALSVIELFQQKACEVESNGRQKKQEFEVIQYD